MGMWMEKIRFSERLLPGKPGHCHPRILQAFMERAQAADTTSRAFTATSPVTMQNTLQPTLGMTKYYRWIPVEAVETGIKLCRRWAYQVKPLMKTKPSSLYAKETLHGRNLHGNFFFSSDPSSKKTGPYMPGFWLFHLWHQSAGKSAGR